MTKVLILDDNKFRHEYFKQRYSGCELYHAYTYSQCVGYLQDHKFDLVQLDHDLGDFISDPDKLDDHELTGANVCDYIKHYLDKNNIPDEIIIHSANPVGAKNMLVILSDFNVRWEMVSQ